MKMRRWTRVTGGDSGVLARKIQSAIDCLALANIAGRALRDGDGGEEVRGRVEAALLRFAGAVQVKIDRRDQFIFDFFDANGRFRQDVVPGEQLEARNLHYSAEEDAVIVACKGEFPQCISKEIFKLNTIRATGRSNLPRPRTDEGGEASMEAVRVLIQAAHATTGRAWRNPTSGTA